MLVALTTAPAFAERVVLVRPVEELPQLVEIFNRLQGELRMHGFEAMFASSQTNATFVEMQRIATLAQAEACVVLALDDGLPTVHLWFIDRLTEKPQTFTFSGSVDADSATELPLRTVELLRSGVLERRDTPSAPIPREKSQPSAAKNSVHVLTSKRPKEIIDRRRFSARVAIGPSWNALAFAPYLGGELSLGFRLNSSFETALLTAIPVTASSVPGTGATAKYRLYHFGSELRLRYPVTARRFWFEYSGGLFLTFIRATATTTLPSLSPVNSTGWAATALFGAGAWLGVGSRVSVGAMARLGLSVPRPIVEVTERSEDLGRPYVTATVGLNAAF